MASAPPDSSIFARIAPQDPQLAAAIRIAVLFYSFTLLVFTVSGFFRNQLQHDLVIGLPMMIGDAVISFGLFYLLRAVSRLSFIARWSLIVLGVVAVALVQAAWDTQLRLWVGAPIDPYLGYVRAATLNVYNAGMFTALLAFQSANLELREQQRLLSASRESERDAHMLALRFQLNPHFLFNTLNAISSLVIVGRAREANAMIDRLSSFLRASLTADPNSLIVVDEEFEMLDSYLEIESVRFGERLFVDMDLPPDLTDALIPPFLLQPLVENAIKYAVAPSKRPVCVRVAADAQEGKLVLTVADDGEGEASVSSGTGVGLANVRERLRLNYGSSATVQTRKDASGFRVDIVMPLQRLGSDPVELSENSASRGPA